MILCIVCYFVLSTGMLCFAIKKDPWKDQLHRCALPFPFHGGSRMALEAHERPLGPKPLGRNVAKYYFNFLLTVGTTLVP